MLFLSAHQPATLKGYKMLFNFKTESYVEPAFAGVIEDATFTTHGAAICIDEESLEILDRWESGYNKTYVTIRTYSGEEISNVLLYLSPNQVRFFAKSLIYF